MNVNEILEKYEDGVIKNIDNQNMREIVEFLKTENCDYIDEILENYLDLFVFPVEEFKRKYNKLNEKYNNQFLGNCSEDMNLLEEFYYV